MKFGAEKIEARVEMVSTGVATVFSRLPLSWRGIGALIVGMLLARWTWILFAPHTLAVIPAKSEVGGNVSDTLFGIAAASGVATATGDAALGNVHLLGVFSGKHGFAVLKIDEKTQRGVALGEDVIKGSKLVEVGSDYVVLEHNGLRQRVSLEVKAKNKEGLVLEPPSSVSGVEQAVAGWSQARQDMQKQLQKKVESANVRQ